LGYTSSPFTDDYDQYIDVGDCGVRTKNVFTRENLPTNNEIHTKCNGKGIFVGHDIDKRFKIVENQTFYNGICITENYVTHNETYTNGSHINQNESCVTENH
jgi:hypothetical protein